MTEIKGRVSNIEIIHEHAVAYQELTSSHKAQVVCTTTNKAMVLENAQAVNTKL